MMKMTQAMDKVHGRPSYTVASVGHRRSTILVGVGGNMNK